MRKKIGDLQAINRRVAELKTSFDEFVKKWYESGGDEVTKRAREWYEKVK